MFVEGITEKRILERQLRMTGKMEAVGRLSGGLAHDFNNLLGVIIGYSHVLKRALGPESPLTEHAIEIEKAGDRAAALTRPLLAFSRQQILTPTVLNLNDLVVDMQKMLPRLIREDIAVSTALDHELHSVRADRNQIEQVIMNLAVNALDAMPEGGRLRIDTKNVRLDELYARSHPGANLEGIQQVGAQVQQILSAISEMRSIFAERVSQGFYLNIEVNRAEAARYGLTIADVQQTVTLGIGGEMVAENVEGRERYPVNIRYSREFRDNVEELRRVLIGTPSGA